MANRYPKYLESFFEDTLGNEVMEKSEVFMGFAKNMQIKDAMDKDDALLLELEKKAHEQEMLNQLQQKIACSPLLKQKLIQARNFIEEHEDQPDIISKIDPDFIKGLELLDLGE
jgi:hypothetical protein